MPSYIRDTQSYPQKLEEINKRYIPEEVTVPFNVVYDSQGQRFINNESIFTAVINNKHGIKIRHMQVDLRKKTKVNIAQYKDEIVIQVDDNLYVKKSWSIKIEWIDPWEEYSQLQVNDKVFKETWKLYAVWWKYENCDLINTKVLIGDEIYNCDTYVTLWSSRNIIINGIKINSLRVNWEWVEYQFNKESKTITKSSDFKSDDYNRIETDDKRLISMTRSGDNFLITETDQLWNKKERNKKINNLPSDIPKLAKNWNTVLVYSDKEIVINDDEFKLNNFGWRSIQQVKTSPDGKRLIIISKNYRTKEVFLSVANRQTSQDDNEQNLFWIIKEVKLEKNDTGQIAISNNWDIGYVSNIQKKLFINEEMIDIEISTDVSRVLEFDFIDEGKLNIKYINENDVTKHYHFPCHDALNEVDHAQKVLQDQEETNRKLIGKINDSDINTPEEFEKLQDMAKKFADIVKYDLELDRELAQLKLENIDLKKQNEELIIQQKADHWKLNVLVAKLTHAIKSINKSFWRQVISDAQKLELEQVAKELQTILLSKSNK